MSLYLDTFQLSSCSSYKRLMLGNLSFETGILKLEIDYSKLKIDILSFEVED